MLISRFPIEIMQLIDSEMGRACTTHLTNL